MTMLHSTMKAIREVEKRLKELKESDDLCEEWIFISYSS